MKKRKTLIIIGSIIIFIIVISISLLFKMPSELRKPIVFSSDSERMQYAAKTDRDVKMFEYMIKSKQGNRASINIDEKALNAYIQASPDIQNKLNSIGAKDVVVKLHKDLVKVGMRIPLNGTMLPANAEIEIRQEPGRKLIVNIKSMKIGGYPAPKSIADKIAGNTIKLGEQDLPAGFTNITIDEGIAIVEANPQAIP